MGTVTQKSSKNKKRFSKKEKNNSSSLHVVKKDHSLNSESFFNRNKSWLEFNSRVLSEALDERTPLMERVRFCDIFRSNNDEFFQKNMVALYKKSTFKLQQTLSDYTENQQLLESLSNKVKEQTGFLANAFENSILPELEKNGIKILTWKDLLPKEKEYLVDYFKKFIFPILTPLAVDAGHPFPFFSNLSKSLGVWMRTPHSNEKLFARVNVPRFLEQWVLLEKNQQYHSRYINIDEIIRNNFDLLFSGMVIEASMIFRVTRHISAETYRDPSEDLKVVVEKGLHARKFAPIVRLEYEKNPDLWILNFLREKLKLQDMQFVEMPSWVCHRPLYTIIKNNVDDRLNYKPFAPQKTKIFHGFRHSDGSDGNLFQAIKKKDYLFHFPYDSFPDTVESFLNAATVDPQVRAIKMTLYRTDNKGTIINALIKAARNNKQVVCIIELNARFDERANLYWADILAKSGVFIIYGYLHQKTHSKIMTVVRDEKDGIRTYSNVATGNYNSQTSRFYTDFSYFTCKKDIGAEILEVFNFLTGRSLKKNYNDILVAPINMYEALIKLIQDEVEIHKKQGNGLIMAKMNSLEDPRMAQELYRASQAGVEVVLIVRGICILRPQVPGLSENIKVYSIVGRFLEHSRIYFFKNGNEHSVDGRYFIGSLDLKKKGLFERVEVLVPIVQKDLKKQLWSCLNLYVSDNRHLWELQQDGSYIQRKPAKGEKIINSQEELIKRSLVG